MLLGRLCVLSLTVPLVLSSASCGGGGGTSGGARSADEAAGEDAGSDYASEEGGDESSDGDPSASRIDCSDGTCSTCGDGLCPAGWYCDESAQGGPACGWLPQCASKSGCGCLEKAMPACSCEEKSGALHLTCK